MMSKLAVDGGTPVRSRPFPTWPQHDEAERRALLRVLERDAWGRTNPGSEEAAAFETEFAAFHGAPSALTVTNGTHALQLALEVLDVGPGDEVIVPAFMPMPTSNAIRQRGAVPVPAEVDPHTYCLDPATLGAVHTGRVRAVIPVHMFGHACDMDGINGWARNTGVPVVQDAAHAHGARWQGRGIGDLGTLVTFSFQESKLMTAGEGGAVLAHTEQALRELDARHRLGVHRGGRRPTTASSNYRVGEFPAAVLRAQLARLPAQNRQRDIRWTQLTALLRTIPGVVPQARDPRCTDNPRYLAALTLDPDRYGGLSRDRVVTALRAEGIPTRPLLPPIYHIPAFWDGPPGQLSSKDELADRCPHAERLGAHGLCWLHHLLLGSEQDVHDMAEALDKVLSALTAGAYS